MIAHWDEARSGRGDAGHIAGEWTDLGRAAGTKTVGLKRITVDPGKWSTPFHRQTAEGRNYGEGVSVDGLPDSAGEYADARKNYLKSDDKNTF